MPKEELKIAGRQSLVARANYSSGFTARVHLSDICTWYDTPTAVEHKLLLLGRRRLMLLRGLLRLHKGNVHVQRRRWCGAITLLGPCCVDMTIIMTNSRADTSTEIALTSHGDRT